MLTQEADIAISLLDLLPRSRTLQPIHFLRLMEALSFWRCFLQIWHDSRSYALKKTRENPLFIYVSFGFVYKYQTLNCITSQNIHEKCCQLNRIFYSAVILIFQVNIQRKPSYLVTVSNKTEPVLEVEDQTTIWAVSLSKGVFTLYRGKCCMTLCCSLGAWGRAADCSYQEISP